MVVSPLSKPVLPLRAPELPLQAEKDNPNQAASYENSPGGDGGSRRSRACDSARKIGGVILLAYAGLNACIWKKFTPVYTATECSDTRAILDKLELGTSSIEMGMQIEVTCSNPNPYGIKILKSTPGRVFVGVDGPRMPIGDLRVLPGSTLPQQGSGTIRVRMDTRISGEQADTMLPHILEDTAVPLFMELKFNVGVSISFGIGGSFATVAPFEKACGLNMAGMLVNQFLPNDGSTATRLGPLVCRETFDDMYIPPVGEKAQTPKNGHMGFSAGQVAPQEVAAGEVSKNVSIGIVICLCLMGSASLLFGCPAGAARLVCCGESRTELPLESIKGKEGEGKPPGCLGCEGAGRNFGAHSRSPQGLSSGQQAAWPHSWMEQLQRAVSRSFSPMRNAASHYFPASVCSPPCSPTVREGVGLNFTAGAKPSATSQREASTLQVPSSPLEDARRTLSFHAPSPTSSMVPRAGSRPSRPASPSPSPSAMEEARSRSRDAAHAERPRLPISTTPRSAGNASPVPRSAPEWPQAWSPSRASDASGGGASRGLRLVPPGADGTASRGVPDAKGLATPTPRSPQPSLALPALSPRSSRSSAPYAGPSPTGRVA